MTLKQPPTAKLSWLFSEETAPCADRQRNCQIPAQGTGKEDYEIDLLVEDILEVCQDEKSTGFYKKVARLLPQQDIYRAISEVKEVRDLGEIKKNKGAIFTSIIKKYARERGLDL